MVAIGAHRWTAVTIRGMILVTMATVVTTCVSLWPTWREYVVRTALATKTTPSWWPTSWREELHVRQILTQTTELGFQATPLDKACDVLIRQTGIQFELDKAALSETGVPTDIPLTLRADRVSLRTMLRLMLDEHSLTCVIENGKVVVTSRSVAAERTTPRTSPSLVSCDIEFLERDDPILAREAAYTVGDYPPDVTAVRRMIDALERDDDDIRINVAYALGKIGPNAALAVPALRDLFTESDNPLIRRQVFDACCEIGEPGMPVVVLGLKSSYSDRRWTVEWLEKQPRAALAAVVDQLAAEARDPDMQVSARAWTALHAFERYGTTSVPLVQAVTRSVAQDY